MLEQVGKALLQSLQVLLVQVSLGYAAVVLEAADRGNDDNRIGTKACHTALDIKELLRAEVSAEACLSNCVISKLEGHLGSGDRVAAMRDIRERTAVHDRGNVLQSLYQVGLKGILKECCHRALCVQVACGYRLLLADFAVCVADDDPGESLLEVVDIACKAKYCHDLGCNRDIIAVFTRSSVDSSAEAVDDKAELTVIHIHASLPCDLAGIDIKLIALVDVVVDHSCQQVVGRADRVEVTCEVQVDILHGNYLCITAAGCAALDTEDRSEGGLTKGYHDLFAQLLQSVRKADGCCGLAFAGRRGVHRCHEDQLSVVSLGVLEKFVVDLGLVFAVLFQILVTDARFLCDLCDREHLTFLRNFNIALVAHSLIPFLFWCVL